MQVASPGKVLQMRALAALICLAMAGGMFAADYRVLERLAVGGEGSWDYLTVDQEGRRLFVSHGTHVAVLDLRTGKPVADIPNTPGVHGIALAHSLQRGFISCGRANHVLIFDLKTLKPLGEVATGENPDAIIFDAASGGCSRSTAGPRTRQSSMQPLEKCSRRFLWAANLNFP